jgi:hypothetical protein
MDRARSVTVSGGLARMESGSFSAAPGLARRIISYTAFGLKATWE